MGQPGWGGTWLAAGRRTLRVGLEELGGEEDDGGDEGDQEPDVDEPEVEGREVERPVVDEPLVYERVVDCGGSAFPSVRSNLGLGSLRRHLGHPETGKPRGQGLPRLLSSVFWRFGAGIGRSVSARRRTGESLTRTRLTCG